MKRLSPWRVARDVFIIVLCVAAALMVSAGIVERTTPRYRSVSRVLVSPNTAMYEGKDLLNALDTLDRATVLATYVEVLNSPRIQQEAAATAGVPFGPDAPYEVRSVVLPGANILEITAEGPNPANVAQLANAVVNHGVAYLQQRFVMYQLDVLDAAQPALAPFAPDEARTSMVAVALALGVGVLLVSLLGALGKGEAPARARGVQSTSATATPVLKR